MLFEFTVCIENLEEFTDLVWDMQPIREITQLDKFSRQIQWSGQIIEQEAVNLYGWRLAMEEQITTYDAV